MHTWNVCKTCNSKLGENIDIFLSDHVFCVFQRHLYDLRGQSKKRPKTPMEGVFEGEDGEKYSLEFVNGKFEAHMLPKFTKNEDGSVFLTIDPRDIGISEALIKRYAKRNNVSIKSINKSEIKHREAPRINVPLSIDILSFKLSIVKIAYEFTVTLYPELLKDSLIGKIASLLEKGDVANLNEIDIVGDGFEDIMPKIFGDFINFANPKRHYIFVTNLEGSLYCFVKLFNVFFCGVKLSNESHSFFDLPIIAINDFEKRDVLLLRLDELAEEVNEFEGLTFKFMGSEEIYDTYPKPVLLTLGGTPQLFFQSGCYAGTLSQIMSKMTEEEVNTDISNGIQTSEYYINGKYGMMTIDGDCLIIDKIISKSKITKI